MKTILLLFCAHLFFFADTPSRPQQEKSFEVLFDGSNLDKWTGNKTDYVIENGILALHPENGGKGNLYSIKEYADFDLRFEFNLTPGANNGIGIRTPSEGDAAYVGMEIQVLDNEHEKYRDLKDYQFHGSVYGVAAAKRGFLKPAGTWNSQHIIARKNRIKVILNGETILDYDLGKAVKEGTADHQAHPGLQNKKGYIGLLWHDSPLQFRNIRIKEL